MFVSCRYEGLSLYNEYKTGSLVPNQIVRGDGFYFGPLNPKDPRYWQDTTSKATSVIFFYADGACYSSYFAEPVPINELARAIHERHNSQNGMSSSQKYGLGWGPYTVRDDSVFMEGYWTLNGKRLAVTTLHLSSDSSKTIRGSHWRPGDLSEWQLDAPTKELDDFTYFFHPSTWKPDSSEFLQRNVEFIQVNDRYMRRRLRSAHH